MDGCYGDRAGRHVACLGAFDRHRRRLRCALVGLLLLLLSMFWLYHFFTLIEAKIRLFKSDLQIKLKKTIC